MEDLFSRRNFCEKISKCLINLLNQKYGVNEASDKCLIQRARHPALKRLGDFHMSKMLVKYLQIQYVALPDKKAHFNLVLCEVLDLLIEKSQTWNIPLIYWKEHDGGFVVGLSRSKAIAYLIPKIFNTGVSATLQLASQSAVILCHVDANPVLHDLRTLIYCEVLCNFFKGCKVVLSKDEEHCGRCLHMGLIRDLDLKMDIMASARIEAYTLNDHIAPANFADCLRDYEKSYPHLKMLHYNGNSTAFASRIANNYKNIIAHKCKAFMSQKSKDTLQYIHVCNQTNSLMAQQSELFHAWYKDEEEVKMEEPNTGHCDRFFTHSGIRSIPSLSTTEFLKKRTEQIKESFESKLQMTADGNHWEDLFNKMRAGLIKLELLKNSTTSSVKLEDSLPSDAVFVLYNYSRICVLIERYLDKVSRGRPTYLISVDRLIMVLK